MSCVQQRSLCQAAIGMGKQSRSRQGREAEHPEESTTIAFEIIRWLSSLQKLATPTCPRLYDTAKIGTTVLCASCHSTNALGALGLPGHTSMTSAMHTLHGPQINLDDGITLDNETDPPKSCYLCHPGNQTRCQRGAMNNTACQDCHGNLSLVGQPPAVAGWICRPARCATPTASAIPPPSTRLDTGASPPIRPSPPTRTSLCRIRNLYRYSSGHGQLYCSGCHGSPHAEFPTLQTNDNSTASSYRGTSGKIAECTVCHTNCRSDLNNGPHGMHTVGQRGLTAITTTLQGGTQQCAYCHGTDYRGSFLSKTSMARSFTTDDGGHKTYNSGDMVSCYDCHNGPGGG